MTDKPSTGDVERVSLEFAKTIIASKGDNGSTVMDESLIIEATNLAIDWIAGEELRSKIIEQNYPDWVDLSKKNGNPRIEMGQKYWFVAKKIDGQTTLPEVIEARVMDINELFGLLTVKVEDVIDALDYKALYFIPEKSSEVFKQNFQPLPPQGVKVENKRFSPTMLSQD